VLDDAQFARVFSTKIDGAEALLAATAGDDPAFISFFSSIAARTGNAGQAAYAAANEALNAIAAREAKRRGASCIVRAFGWGPWDGGMVDATLRERFVAAGVGLISREEGARYFAEHATRRPERPVSVVAAPARAAQAPASLEWAVSLDTMPWLADHQVRGRVVLPVVVVIERILRGAGRLFAAGPLSVRDLQVLSGVTFAPDNRKTVPLAISYEPNGDIVHVTIRDGANRNRYRAVIAREAQSSPASQAPLDSIGAWPFDLTTAYSGPLFHGPSFAAIEALETRSAQGGSALLKGGAALGWAEEPWSVDPAVLDGGLQLGLLWAYGEGRSLMLPQKIARIDILARRPAAEPVRCRFRARPVSDSRIDFDFWFETIAGAPLAEVHGGEFYAVGAAVSASP
jgi:hypothetical protein